MSATARLAAPHHGRMHNGASTELPIFSPIPPMSLLRAFSRWLVAALIIASCGARLTGLTCTDDSDCMFQCSAVYTTFVSISNPVLFLKVSWAVYAEPSAVVYA